ncbi:Ubiquinol oxidase [Musa troglodytarum]|uniref:Ubiquinol oxidase n=1 Tax=Musa troglodytarum TaxID=320322 RepID=A0A9E7G268_9LILI|nr:Ubiquinol oxidase [Musa troglodytarum]
MMMSSRNSGTTVLRHLGFRLFSSAVASRVTASEPAYSLVLSRPFVPSAPARPPASVLMRLFPVRMASTSAAPALGGEQEEREAKSSSPAAPPNGSKAVASYWGIEGSKITKEDGTPWRWSCFMPWETYEADLSIDLKKHHVPRTLLDKIAYWTVKSLRFPTDIFFQVRFVAPRCLVVDNIQYATAPTLTVARTCCGQRRYGCRAMMLETVAAVPGMVGGMLLHLQSLRRFEPSGGWIRVLLEEAENERMHLMTFMEVAQPRWYERALVFAVQGVFFNAYFVAYLLSPKLAHRMVGYLEEEAIHSYTEYLKDLEAGKIQNVPAPGIAIDYWRLPADATLKDVVMVVRADEAHHRDVNHFASDIHYQGMQLKDTPAPLGYH